MFLSHSSIQPIIISVSSLLYPPGPDGSQLQMTSSTQPMHISLLVDFIHSAHNLSHFFSWSIHSLLLVNLIHLVHLSSLFFPSFVSTWSTYLLVLGDVIHHVHGVAFFWLISSTQSIIPPISHPPDPCLLVLEDTIHLVHAQSSFGQSHPLNPSFLPFFPSFISI